MADYIVTSGELTTVANAIREKNGTSSSLSWPDGFVSGINSGSGGGSSDFSTATVTVEFIRDSGNQQQRPMVYVPCILNEQGTSFISYMPTDFPCIVPLYQGNAYGSVQSNILLGDVTIVSVSATGNIQADDNDVLIQGDGTITVHYTTMNMV